MGDKLSRLKKALFKTLLLLIILPIIFCISVFYLITNSSFIFLIPAIISAGYWFWLFMEIGDIERQRKQHHTIEVHHTHHKEGHHRHHHKWKHHHR